MLPSIFLLLALSLATQHVHGTKHKLDHLELSSYVTDADDQTIPPFDEVYYFDQLIDHENPELGTFKQRYYHTWEWYHQGTCCADRFFNDL